MSIGTNPERADPYRQTTQHDHNTQDADQSHGESRRVVTQRPGRFQSIVVTSLPRWISIVAERGEDALYFQIRSLRPIRRQEISLRQTKNPSELHGDKSPVYVCKVGLRRLQARLQDS